MAAAIEEMGVDATTVAGLFWVALAIESISLVTASSSNVW